MIAAGSKGEGQCLQGICSFFALKSSREVAGYSPAQRSAGKLDRCSLPVQTSGTPLAGGATPALMEEHEQHQFTSAD